MSDAKMIISVISAIVGLVITFRIFFSGFGDFMTALGHACTPDLISLFRGDFYEDWKNETKLSLWLISGALFGLAAYQICGQVFGL